MHATQLSAESISTLYDCKHAEILQKLHVQGLAGDLVEGFPDKLLKLPGLSEDSEILFFDS